MTQWMRHHGEVAATCIHGFASGACLICQTLDGPPGNSQKPAGAKPASSASRRARIDRAARADRTAALEPTSPRVMPPEARALRVPAGLKLLGLLVGVVIVVVLAWTALHLVFAILHILELIAVAVVTGYVGYKAGVHHGRRSAG